MESRALCVALVGLAIGCNEDRPLAFVPVDAAAAIEKKDLTAGSSDGNSAADLSMPDLAVAAPRPCTLVAAGEPVQTVSSSLDIQYNSDDLEIPAFLRKRSGG